ncbi:MAG: transposase, partial [bacterium]|nr:transposase [bacterium]
MCRRGYLSINLLSLGRATEGGNPGCGEGGGGKSHAGGYRRAEVSAGVGNHLADRDRVAQRRIGAPSAGRRPSGDCRRHPSGEWSAIYSVYDFTESRARDGPARFLAGFEGHLHADAYGGYDHIYLGSNNSILEVACWAHARRKFFDAARSSPRESHQILEWVGQLYDIEDRARELSDQSRQSLRQQESDPV